MTACTAKGCSREATTSGLCDIHEARATWLRNDSLGDLGIVKFSHALFPQRINPKFGVPMMHKEIYRDLLAAHVTGRDKMERLHVIAAPREHSKSTIISYVFVLYCVLFRLKNYIVLISESYEKSTQFIRAIKKALASERVKYYFGDISTKTLVSDGGKWTEGHIVTSTGCTITALGMGKSTRGLIEDTRPDLVIADDIESENNTKTEESRDGNWKWWNAQVVPAADVINGQCVYIGTMVHHDCILAKLFEHDNHYHKRFYQVYTDETHTATIWPEKFTLDLVKRIEANYRADDKLGVGLFYMEYLNVATNPESRTFGPSSIVEAEYDFFIDKTAKWIRRGPEVVNVTTFLGVDPASSLKNTAKYSAIMAGAMDVYGRVYILEYILDRLPIRTDADIGKEGLVDATLRMIEKYRPEKIGWEMDGVGRPIGQLLRQELMKLVDRSPEIGFPMIVEIAAPHDQGKIDKIRNMLESPHKTQKVLQKASMTELRTSQEQFPKSRILDILDAECNMLAVAHVPYVIEHYAEAGDYRLNPGRKVIGDRKVDWEVAI